MIRLFAALALPVDVRAQLSARQSGLAGARWIDSAALHMTLRFIGEVSEPDAQDISLALVAIQAPAFELGFSGMGYFERRGSVHSVWAKPTRSDALKHLRSKVESAVVRCGLEPETRKFKPHVTLARLKDTPEALVGPWLEQAGAAVIPPFTVDSFTLFQSRLGHGGARYIPINEYPLFQPL